MVLLDLKSGISRVNANRSAMGSGIMGTGGGSWAASGDDSFFDPFEEPIRNSERFFLSETYPPSETSAESIDFLPMDDFERKGLGRLDEEM